MIYGNTGTNEMSERRQCLYVALDTDVTESDVKSIIDAIRMIRGVNSAEIGASDYTEYNRRMEILWEVRDSLSGLSNKLKISDGKETRLRRVNDAR